MCLLIKNMNLEDIKIIKTIDSLKHYSYIMNKYLYKLLFKNKK